MTLTHRRWLGALFQRAPIVHFYDALTNNALWAKQNAKLVQHLPLPLDDGARVLDLGCGTGIGTIAIASAFGPHVEVIGADFSAQMVAIANKRHASAFSNVSFSQADATDLHAFETGSLDAVLANSFLYLVPHPRRVLAEIARVLRPGARVVFMEPRDEAHLLAAICRAATGAPAAIRRPLASLQLGLSLAFWRLMSRLEGRMPRAQLLALLAEAGFVDVAIENTLVGLGQHVVGTRQI